MAGFNLISWLKPKKKNKKKAKAKQNSKSKCNSPRGANKREKRSSPDFNTSALERDSIKSTSPVNFSMVCPNEDRPANGSEDHPMNPVFNPWVPNTNQLSVATQMPLDMESTSSASSHLMMIGENQIMRPVSKKDNLSELVNQLFSDETMSSVRFQSALQKLCSVPIDVINHFAIIGEFTKYLKLNNRMTDVQIRLGQKMYHAHRVTLACFSEFFQKLFCSQSEVISVPIEIDLTGLNEKGFQAYLNYIYSGELVLNSDTVADLLLVSESLGVPHLRTMCLDYTKNINLHQALIIILHCVSQESILYKHAFEVILQNFRIIDQYPDFFRLGVDTLCAILYNNCLVVESESQVFRIGMQWVMYNKPERQHHAMRIMHCVRFSLMTYAEIYKCASCCEMLRDDPGFRRMIFEAGWVASCREHQEKDPMECFYQPQRTICPDRPARESQAQKHTLTGKKTDNQCWHYTPVGQQHESQHAPRLNTLTEHVQRSPTSPRNQLAAKHLQAYEIKSSSGQQAKPSQHAPEKIRTDNLVAEQPAPKKNRTDTAVATQPAPEKKRLDTPVATQSAPEKSRIDTPVAVQPAQEKSHTDNPVAVQPAPERTYEGTPFADQLPATHTIQIPKSGVSGQSSPILGSQVQPAQTKPQQLSLSDMYGQFGPLGMKQHYMFETESARSSEWTPDSDGSDTGSQYTVLSQAPRYSPQELDENESASEFERDERKLSSAELGDILALGSFQREDKPQEDVEEPSDLEMSSSEEVIWQQAGSVPVPRVYHAVTASEDLIYISGGLSNDDSITKPTLYKEVYSYSSDTNAWTQCCDMLTARCKHAMVRVSGMLYAIGGVGENGKVLNSVECYNPKTNTWHFVEGMSSARCNIAACEYNGLIYVVGGEGRMDTNRFGNPMLKKVEVYHPSYNCWARMRSLRTPRSCGKLVNANGDLYLCGGLTSQYKGPRHTTVMSPSIDCYNCLTDQWEPITKMKIPRKHPGASVIGKLIYLMGGQSNNNESLQSVEVYDTEKRAWVNSTQNLPHGARWLACVALPRK